MSDKIDIRFKKAFREESVEPPAYLWENIRKELDNKRKQRKLFAWWYSSAAGVILLLGLAWLLPQKLPMEAIQSPAGISMLGQSYIQNEYTNQELVDVLSAPRTLPAEQYGLRAFPERVVETPVEISRLFIENRISTPIPPTVTIHTPVRKDFIPLINKNSYETQKLYQKFLLADAQGEPTVTKSSPLLSLGGYIAPGYSSGNYTAPAKSTRSYNYPDNQMQGIFNLSGGLKLSVSTGKRFTIQTGIMYTKMGQKSTGEGAAMYKLQLMSMSGTTKQPSNIASPLGNIRTHRKMPSIYYAANAASGNSADIEQIFGAIEIPLTVKYRLNDNKLKISILGGFSGSFIVDNKAYLNHGNKREYMGTTEDIRPFNISTDWALGIEYPVFPRITFMVEPGFRYYLQSISKNEDVDFKPYMFSFSTGIGITF